MTDKNNTPTPTSSTQDQPYFDPTVYGYGPNASVTDTTERAAITHHTLRMDGQILNYTARAGHLVPVDPVSSKPYAKIFYVSFTLDTDNQRDRPVTYFYNGGPGSSSVFLLLGSFAPRRIKTAMPDFTPPAPYTLEDNTDSLIDRSDLVFINPVGTGYSTAVAPWENQDFWGVDQDAASLKQFIKRYLSKFRRWNSPKFLFGESYGTARSAVLAYMLHEDGVDLNGVTLQSSILDYGQSRNPVGALPTAAADAWYHDQLGLQSRPAELPDFMTTVCAFARNEFGAALDAYPYVDDATIDKLSEYTGIDKPTLMAWHLQIAAGDGQGHMLFLISLLEDKGLAVGAYDGRVTGVDTGIARDISPNSGANDPTMTAVSGVYTTMWNVYLHQDLKFTCKSAFTDLNDLAFEHWDFHHTSPTGAEKGINDQGYIVLYTAGDLAATMSLNVELKVLSANGYYDFVTPFFQTELDLKHMPLANTTLRQNLTKTFYPSGHMIYLDGDSRTALKADVAAMVDAATADHAAVAHIRALQARKAPKQASRS